MRRGHIRFRSRVSILSIETIRFLHTDDEFQIGVDALASFSLAY
jgi:hypothetical protein